MLPSVSNLLTIFLENALKPFIINLSNPLTMQNHAITVGFRLDRRHHELLEARAKLLQESVGDSAKKLVIEKLNEKDHVAVLAEKVSTLETQLSQLRRDLSLSVYAILVFAGKVTEDEAKAWVSQNLKMT